MPRGQNSNKIYESSPLKKNLFVYIVKTYDIGHLEHLSVLKTQFVSRSSETSSIQLFVLVVV